MVQHNNNFKYIASIIKYNYDIGYNIYNDHIKVHVLNSYYYKLKKNYQKNKYVVYVWLQKDLIQM